MEQSIYNGAPALARTQERQEALRRYHVLDTAPEKDFDQVTRLVAQVTDAPTALITLIDEERQWFKSCFGYNTRETSIEVSFCVHAVHERETLVVEDATKDPRFADNPLVTGEPGWRFYAGAPLRTPEGVHIGTLCIIDYEPRVFDAAQRAILEDLADLVVGQFELRSAEAQYRKLFQGNPQPTFIYDIDTLDLLDANAAAARTYGYPERELRALRLPDLVAPVSLEEHTDRSTGGTAPFTARHRTRDGTALSVEVREESLLYEGRQARVATMIDVAQRERGRQYQRLVENVQEVVFETDLDGKATFLNAAWERVTGFSVEEALDETLLHFVHPKDRVESLQAFAPLLQRRQDLFRHRTRFLTREGETLPMQFRARLITDEDGTPVGTVGTLTPLADVPPHESEAPGEPAETSSEAAPPAAGEETVREPAGGEMEASPAEELPAEEPSTEAPLAEEPEVPEPEADSLAEEELVEEKPEADEADEALFAGLDAERDEVPGDPEPASEEPLAETEPAGRADVPGTQPPEEETPAAEAPEEEASEEPGPSFEDEIFPVDDPPVDDDPPVEDPTASEPAVADDPAPGEIADRPASETTSSEEESFEESSQEEPFPNLEPRETAEADALAEPDEPDEEPTSGNVSLPQPGVEEDAGLASVISEGLPELEALEGDFASGETLTDVRERLSTRPPQLHPTSLDFADHLRSTLDELEPAARRKGLMMHRALPNRAVPILADPGALRLLLAALVNHAIASTDEGSITVSGRGEDDTVRLRVVDTGADISKNLLNSLLNVDVAEPDDGDEAQEQHLQFVHRLVHLMQGSVEMESQRGRGTVFTVMLPCRPDLDEAAVPAEPTPVEAAAPEGSPASAAPSHEGPSGTDEWSDWSASDWETLDALEKEAAASERPASLENPSPENASQENASPKREPAPDGARASAQESDDTPEATAGPKDSTEVGAEAENAESDRPWDRDSIFSTSPPSGDEAGDDPDAFRSDPDSPFSF